MIGIIFAAGIGTRLKPFTDFHPKALAEVGGKPILVRVTEKLLDAGARKIIVNIHHFPEQIREYIAAQPFADKIDFSDESALLLDTGGALAKIARENGTMASVKPDEPVVVHNADIYTDFPLREMLDAHTESAADATILCDPGRSSSRHFLFDSAGVLRGWENSEKNIVRPSGLDRAGLTAAAFGGVHILSRKTIERIAATAPAVLEPFSITDWYIDNSSKYTIKAYTPQRAFKWFDIGTTEKLAKANEHFK